MPSIPQGFKAVDYSSGRRKLLFIHGFGGNLSQPGIKWALNRFTEAGFGVTYIQLPVVIRDFKKELVEPAREVGASLGDHITAGFSLGGLTAAYLEGSSRTVYLSPFWGISDRLEFRGLTTALSLLARINMPPLKRHFEKEDAGPLATDEEMYGIPEYILPKTVHEMRKAQLGMPEPRKDDIVFYSPADRIVSISAIERRDMIRYTYRGGHMFYLSRERKEIMDRIISCMEGPRNDPIISSPLPVHSH